MGASGAGKTTVAARAAAALGVPHRELDAFHHLPGWQERPTSEFRSEVARLVAEPAWVIDGNYSKARDIVWGRADTVVFLDLPRWRVMAQLIPRTLSRVITGAELWHGNRERWTNLVSAQPEENILLWSWTTHHKQRERWEAAMDDPTWAHIAFVRICSRSESRSWLAGIAID